MAILENEPTLDNNNNSIDFPANNNNSISFKFKQLEQGKEEIDDIAKAKLQIQAWMKVNSEPDKRRYLDSQAEAWIKAGRILVEEITQWKVEVESEWMLNAFFKAHDNL